MKQGKFLMGNGVLTRLWNQYPDNMEACSAPERDFLPQMDDCFEEAIEQLDPNNQIEEDDLSVGLYMWAHRYDIMPLFKLCQDHLGATLCEEDLLEVLEVADLYDDKVLLSKIAGKESLFRNRRFMLDEIFQSLSYF